MSRPAASSKPAPTAPGSGFFGTNVHNIERVAQVVVGLGLLSLVEG